MDYKTQRSIKNLQRFSLKFFPYLFIIITTHLIFFLCQTVYLKIVLAEIKYTDH